jgi:hypothetical protein
MVPSAYAILGLVVGHLLELERAQGGGGKRDAILQKTAAGNQLDSFGSLNREKIVQGSTIK